MIQNILYCSQHTMKELYFITGNENKARQLTEFLGLPISHIRLDLDEIQSLNLREIGEHKARHAFQKVEKPVLVEDVSLEFEALGGLPGPFIRFFVDTLPLETICSLLDGKSRNATAKGVYAHFDGTELTTFEGMLNGTISERPRGRNGYGWDAIFIPQGYTKTRAEMNEEEYKSTFTCIKPITPLKDFLYTHNTKS